MQRERPLPPTRPNFEERQGRGAMARPQPPERPQPAQRPERPSFGERFGSERMPRPALPQPTGPESATVQTAEPEQATESAPQMMAPPVRPAMADRLPPEWAQPPVRQPYAQPPGYGYGYPTAPYGGGYQNYPGYYPTPDYQPPQYPYPR